MVWDEQIQGWFYNRTVPENKSETEASRHRVNPIQLLEYTRCVSGGRQPKLARDCDENHNMAEICTGAAGFCSLPSNIAAPFNRS